MTKGVAVVVPPEEVQEVAFDVTMNQVLETVLLILDNKQYRVLLSGSADKEKS